MYKLNLILTMLVLIICSIACFFIISLLSFSDLDPCWSQSTSDFFIYNLFGISGAWVSDILLSAFGITAFIIPMLLFFGSYLIYKQKKNLVLLIFFIYQGY